MIGKEFYKDRKLLNLELGKEYNVMFYFKEHLTFRCKFIQTTEKGFNMLNLETNKCMLKRHLYKSKYPNPNAKEDKMWFSVHQLVSIKKTN